MSSIITGAAATAHSAAASLLASSPIKVGDKLPAIKVKESNPENKVEIHNISGKILILGVPAAFSPPCGSQIPDYIERYQEFVAKGIQGIFVVAINDAFVTKAWKSHLAGEGTPIHFIADDAGEFTSKLGLIFDAQTLLGGPRSKRYVIVADSGKVTHLAVEDEVTDVKKAKADEILALL